LCIYIVTAFASEFMEQLKAAHDEGLQFELANKPLSSAQIRNIAYIVQLAKTHELQRAAHHKLVLTLFVVSLNPDTQKLVGQITTMLSTLYQPGYWVFEVVEVLSMPEKALERDVFATPMLIRELPEPVLKLLGDLSRMSSVMAAITTQAQNTGGQTIIV